MSAANHADGVYGWTRAAEQVGAWLGKHRSQARASLGLRRMFYVARHRR